MCVGVFESSRENTAVCSQGVLLDQAWEPMSKTMLDSPPQPNYLMTAIYTPERGSFLLQFSFERSQLAFTWRCEMGLGRMLSKTLSGPFLWPWLKPREGVAETRSCGLGAVAFSLRVFLKCVLTHTPAHASRHQAFL